jgi:hypothetical protein
VQRRLHGELRLRHALHEVREWKVLDQLDPVRHRSGESERGPVHVAKIAVLCDEHQPMRNPVAHADERAQQPKHVLVRLHEPDEDDGRHRGSGNGLHVGGTGFEPRSIRAERCHDDPIGCHAAQAHDLRLRELRYAEHRACAAADRAQPCVHGGRAATARKGGRCQGQGRRAA